MEKYQDIIQAIYDEIIVFVETHKDIETELFSQEQAFSQLAFTGENLGQLFFDWFIFDYILETTGQRLMDVFLASQKGQLDHALYAVYEKVGHDRFGFFKVKSVKTGQALIGEDAITKTDYQVFDSRITQTVAKGDYIIGRLLPFDNAYIFASQCLVFKAHEYDVFGLLVSQYSASLEGRIDAFTVYQALYPIEMPEQLPVEEKFALLCQEGGLDADAIEDCLLQMQIEIKARQMLPQQLLAEITDVLHDPVAWLKIEDFRETFFALWNHYVAQIYPEAKRGPLESSLLTICMTASAEHFSVNGQISAGETNRISHEMQQWSDAWFDTPRAELKGETPKAVILRERAELGMPERPFGYSVVLDALPQDPWLEKKAEKIFYQAADCMNQDDHQHALELYEEYLQMWDGNHVVWHNLGVCHAMMLQKRKAEKCFRKAWEIKPDYDLAVDKWEQLKSMNKAEMVQMICEMRQSKSKQ